MGRMTIDEAIAFCIEKSNNIKLKAEPEVFIQIAEWLEELKAYREIGTVEECKNSVLDIERAYNKAIDDFVKLVHKHDWNIRNINENSFIYGAIDTLAEQLKAGGENEQSI